VLHDLQGLGSLTTIWFPFSDTWDTRHPGSTTLRLNDAVFTYKTANFKPLHPHHHQFKYFKILMVVKFNDSKAVISILNENF